MNGVVALREVAGEAWVTVPHMRGPRLRYDIGEGKGHLAALVGFFDVAADGTVAGQAEVGDGSGPGHSSIRLPPLHTKGREATNWMTGIVGVSSKTHEPTPDMRSHSAV